MSAIKTVKVLDIQHEDVPPVVYQYFFATVEYMCNDATWTTGILDPYELKDQEKDDYSWDYTNEAWEKQMERLEGPGMAHKRGDLLENRITGKEACLQTQKWLMDQGVKPTDDFKVSIWW